MEDNKRVARGSKAPRVTVKITQEIIDDAVRRDSGHCMIAEAIKAAVPDAKGVSVDLASIRWTDRQRGLRFVYLTPRIGQLALLRFDQGDDDIEPFTFRLRGATVIRANTKKQAAAVPKKAKIHATPGQVRGSSNGGAPSRVGGTAPPIGPLSNSARVKVGRPREFGLRALSK